MSVEVTLELGHRASLRSNPTPEGFTHDWVVFVRGVGGDGNNIQYFVEKVVFHLHESFPKHKRVVKEPPYQVAESGYAGFLMPIEVHFRSKEEPKKVCFEYDLFLRLEEPVFNIRYEKLTFQYPTEDFRKKLLRAGGGCPTAPPTLTSGVLQTQVSTPAQHTEEHRTVAITKTPSITAEKKPRSHSTPKEINKTPAPPVRSGQPFTDIFGSPIRAKHSSGNPPAKTKESAHSNHQKSAKVPSLPGAPCKELKPVKENHPTTELKNSKVTKSVKQEKEAKVTTKRSLLVDGKISNTVPDKKKRRTSTSLDNDEKIDGITKPKDSKEKKEKHRNKVSSSASLNKNEKLKNKISESKESAKLSKVNTLVHKIDIKHSSPNGESNPQELETLGGKDLKNKLNDSSSPVPEIARNNHPLSTMIAEMDNALISPLSSDAEDSFPVKEKEAGSDLDDTIISTAKPVTKSSVKQDKKNSKSRAASKSKVTSSQGSYVTVKESQEVKDSVTDEKVKSKKKTDPSDLKELVELQQKIMSLNDRHLLQRVVDVIEKTGRFQMTSSSFDFDLCSLDHNTLKKLNCLLVK